MPEASAPGLPDAEALEASATLGSSPLSTLYAGSVPGEKDCALDSPGLPTPSRGGAPSTPDVRYAALQGRLEGLEHAGLYRRLRPVGASSGPPIRVSLCSNDYLGLTSDVRVRAGAEAALRRYGTGSGSARLLAGELACHRALEEALADWLGYADVLLFNSGWHANLGLFPVLAGRGGRIVSDALNHASIIDGCRLSGAQVVKVPHLGLERMEQALLEGPAERLEPPAGVAAGTKVLAVEGVFSMDGDIAPVERLASLARRHDAVLVVDDAHGLGVLGEQGRGVAVPHADILVGTFGKAFGSAGAFVAGPTVVREALINLARPFVFTTGPTPGAVGAAHAALEIFRQDPEPQERLAQNVAFMRRELPRTGFEVPEGAGHILPLHLGDAALAVRFSAMLLERGVELRAVRPPTVPEGTSRLRLSLSAHHTEDALSYALEAILAVRRALGMGGNAFPPG